MRRSQSTWSGFRAARRISAGAARRTANAVRYPERVAPLVRYGGFAAAGNGATWRSCGRRSRSIPNSRWRGRCSPSSADLARACRWCPISHAAERSAREEAERAVAIDPNASDVLGFAGCALVGYRRHRTRARDIAPRARARFRQRAGPHRVRRDRGQTGPVRRGHQERQVRHALEPARISA